MNTQLTSWLIPPGRNCRQLTNHVFLHFMYWAWKYVTVISSLWFLRLVEIIDDTQTTFYSLLAGELRFGLVQSDWTCRPWYEDHCNPLYVFCECGFFHVDFCLFLNQSLHLHCRSWFHSLDLCCSAVNTVSYTTCTTYNMIGRWQFAFYSRLGGKSDSSRWRRIN